MSERDKKYLAFVRGFYCCSHWMDETEAWPEDDGGKRLPIPGIVAHHVRMGNRGGMGLKPSDYFTVPLADARHRALHQNGEAAFWAKNGLDPRRIMRTLLLAFAEETGIDAAVDHPVWLTIAKLTVEIEG